ncbi:hypothetical protein KJ691_00950 [bacterium]|nr:hypothetical protein [bacterium]
MSLHTITKQKLLSEPFSYEALRLARAIYNTYVNLDKELSMEIKIKSVENLLKLDSGVDTVSYIKKLFEELNEPLAVRDFKFYAQVYPIRFITFCRYTIKDTLIEIELSEEFLHAESEYMLEPFLTDKR